MALGNLSFTNVHQEAKENAEWSTTGLLADLPQTKPILGIYGAAPAKVK